MISAPAAAGDERSGDDRPFSAGTWTLQLYGSATVGIHQEGIYAAHAGFGYHFADALSINLEGVGGAVNAAGDEDGAFGGFDILLRWHAVRGERWSLYLDAGTGFQQATTSFPSDSHHNFRSQIGGGVTLELTDHARLMLGARYIHVSNAGATDGNGGLDAALLYAGLMFPF